MYLAYFCLHEAPGQNGLQSTAAVSAADWVLPVETDTGAVLRKPELMADAVLREPANGGA